MTFSYAQFLPAFQSANSISPPRDLNPISKIATDILENTITSGTSLKDATHAIMPVEDEFDHMYAMQDAIRILDGVKQHIGILQEYIRDELKREIDLRVAANSYESEHFKLVEIEKKSTQSVNTENLRRHDPSTYDKLLQIKLEKTECGFKPTITELVAVMGKDRAKVYINPAETIGTGEYTLELKGGVKHV